MNTLMVVVSFNATVPNSKSNIHLHEVKFGNAEIHTELTLTLMAL